MRRNYTPGPYIISMNLNSVREEQAQIAEDIENHLSTNGTLSKLPYLVSHNKKKEKPHNFVINAEKNVHAQQAAAS